jgi:acyl-coenzyme A synthetase/AMP-(fatty) acid ligase
VEEVLRSHPSVTGAVVMGIPDRLRGEVVAAAVSLKEGASVTEQKLRQLCLEKMISYKVPKQIIFVDSLPVNTDGSVDKDGLRKQLSIPPVFGEI